VTPLAANVADLERQQGHVAGALDRDRYLALDLGRVARLAAADDLAPLVDATPEPGHVFVIHLFVIEEDRLPAAAAAKPAAAAGPAAGTARSPRPALTVIAAEAGAGGRPAVTGRGAIATGRPSFLSFSRSLAFSVHALVS